MRHSLSFAVACLFLSSPAFAQTEPPAGLLKGALAKSAASKGASAGVTRFKPSGSRLILEEFVNGVTDVAEERKLLRETFDKMMTEYEKAVKAAGRENDLAAALSYAVMQYWSLWKGEEVPEGGDDALLKQITGAMENPQTAKLSNAEKQRLYEASLYGAFSLQFTGAVAEEGKDEAAKKAVAQAAQAALTKLLGVDAAKIRLTANGLEGTAPPPEAGARGAAGSLDSVLASYSLPEGWETKTYPDGTLISHGIVEDDERRHDCEIRLMAPRPAPGGAAKAFQDLWKETLADFQAGSVTVAYRRVLPCGAAANYMGGFYKTKSGADMYVAVYALDLGGKVLPIVLSVVPGRRAQFEYNPNGSAYTALANAAVPVLNSLKFKKTPPVAALFTRAEVVGKWAESSSAMVVGGYYVTAGGGYAGEMMSASGMLFHLNPDGTFKYRFSYSNRGGRDVGTDNNEGRFTMSNDILNCDPKFARTYKYRYRIAGAGYIQTDKGNLRALVLRGSDRQGNFELPPLVPNGKDWQGSVDWLTETKMEIK